MKDERSALAHMRTACRKCLKYAQAGEEAFYGEELIQDAMIRCLEVLGEAAKRVGPELRERFPSVEFRRAAGVRDVMIHAYDVVDLPMVWEVAMISLPPLLEQLENALVELEWVDPLD